MPTPPSLRILALAVVLLGAVTVAGFCGRLVLHTLIALPAGIPFTEPDWAREPQLVVSDGKRVLMLSYRGAFSLSDTLELRRLPGTLPCCDEVKAFAWNSGLLAVS